MANRSRNLTDQVTEPGFLAGSTTYATITAQIRKSIEVGGLPAGTVLLEGPLASLFGSSRSPVKRALASLEEEGLVSRFGGRGLLVGKHETPRRLRLTSRMLLLDDDDGISAKSFAWQPHYYDIEREIILRSVFGRARVNELALARHLNVGRTVAHDLLTHAREVGIVQKDDGSRWWIVPLDETRFANLYQLRILLEPSALISAMEYIPDAKLDEVHSRLRRAQDDFPGFTSADLDKLEEDIHIDCLGYCRNPEIIEALKRSRCILVAGKHIQLAQGNGKSVDPFMQEHLEIVAALREKDQLAVGMKLIQHLELSAEKAAQRLKTFRNSQLMADLPYILD